MTYLLDTHTLIWALTKSAELSDNVRDILQDGNNEIFVSTLSFWEMAIKRSVQKLDLQGGNPEDFVVETLKADFHILPLSFELCSSFYKLTATHHKDPFDRLLISQAIVENMTLVSADANFGKYQAKLLW